MGPKGTSSSTSGHTIGDSDTFTGDAAGYSNTAGNNNTFSGYAAGYYHTAGNDNTATR
jgi:hypothetical protein